MNTWDDILKQVSEEIRPLLKDLINNLLPNEDPRFKKYTAAVARDLSRWFIDNAGSDDETAQRNLRHLKAQLQNLAMIQQLHIHRLTLDRLEKVLQIVLRIALSSLKVTLPIP